MSRQALTTAVLAPLHRRLADVQASAVLGVTDCCWAGVRRRLHDAARNYQTPLLAVRQHTAVELGPHNHPELGN